MIPTVARRPLRPNEISSGGVVVRPAPTGPEVCLVSDGKHWGFPKGLVEPGESPEGAALREIAEETGIPRGSLQVIAALPNSEYVFRRPNRGALVFKRVHHFLVGAPENVALHPDPAEIAEAAWLGFDEARGRLTFKSAIEVLDAALLLLDAGGSKAAP
jgi:8-oxo-dGTP pyrophosphatase MutT (NUDIX family)